MTARDEAIEAAARKMAEQNMAGGASPWDAEDDGPGFAHTYGWASPSEFRRGHREMAAEVLAAAVPVLLNDLADRIDKMRTRHHDEFSDTDPQWRAVDSGIAAAFEVVRAAAEGWGQ